MTVELNHTIVWCRDQQESAAFLADVLGFGAAEPVRPVLVVEAANGVSLDYHEIDGDIASQHYAFLISEDGFDQIYGRIQERGLDYWGSANARWLMSTPTGPPPSGAQLERQRRFH